MSSESVYHLKYYTRLHYKSTGMGSFAQGEAATRDILFYGALTSFKIKSVLFSIWLLMSTAVLGMLPYLNPITDLYWELNLESAQLYYNKEGQVWILLSWYMNTEINSRLFKHICVFHWLITELFCHASGHTWGMIVIPKRWSVCSVSWLELAFSSKQISIFLVSICKQETWSL